MLDRILTPLLSILLALAVASGVYLHISRAKALKTAQDAQTQARLYQGSYEAEKRAVAALRESAEKQALALKKRAEQAEAQANKAKAQAQALSQAQKANPEWSAQPLPKEIQDALR